MSRRWCDGPRSGWSRRRWPSPCCDRSRLRVGAATARSHSSSSCSRCCCGSVSLRRSPSARSRCSLAERCTGRRRTATSSMRRSTSSPSARRGWCCRRSILMRVLCIRGPSPNRAFGSASCLRSAWLALPISSLTTVVSIVREEARHLLFVGLAMVSLSPLVLVVMVHEWPLVPLFYPALISLYHNAASSVAHEHDALHDWLTGLGNRELLHREATRALDALPRPGGGVAVLVLDVDRFKRVNDTLGHAAGDRLLQIVAERL